MQLFHFSEEPDIREFAPRPILVPSWRPAGREWLNGPLVWAIDAPHQPLYLFPRECPRILLWPTAGTSEEDHARIWGKSTARMLAFIEEDWRERLGRAVLYRYEFPIGAFEDLNDAGMRVSRTHVSPVAVTRLDHLPAALAEEDVELRVVRSLVPLRNVWSTTLHASGIRLRNAQGW